MSVKFLDLKAQYASIKKEIDAAVAGVLDECHFIMGPNVSAFEKEMAAHLGVRQVITCASGSDALLLALMAYDIGPGDEVITSPFTFFATAGAIARLGARTVFADIETDTYNIDPAAVEKLINKKTKAVIPVHIYGQSCDMDPIVRAAGGSGVRVIEDCAQAFGASYKGRPVASIGDIGCISFFPTKNLGCYGDGGAISTNDDALAEKIRVLKLHGSKPKYFHSMVGINSRLDEIQAAVLRVKLKYISGWNARRREIAAAYNSFLEGAGVTIPREAAHGGHIYHQYTVRVKNRDMILEHLKKLGVEAGVYYPLPLHLQACFKDLAYAGGDMPVSESVSKDILSLPIYPEMTEGHIKEAADALIGACQKYNG